MYRICHLSVIPVRKESTDQSEMVSQLLFGEMAEVLEESGSWQKIRTEYDSYTGWVDRKQMLDVSEEDYNKINSGPVFTPSACCQSIETGKGSDLQILRGSTLSFSVINFAGKNLSKKHFSGELIDLSKPDTKRWMEFALQYLNAPYLWGGRSPFGIDCSGFTQIVMKMCGVKLLRDAIQQSTQGKTIHLTGESAPGDLAFFENKDGKIVHVGIILPDQQIIHASGKVRIDKFDQQGIFNQDSGAYTHQLRLIKRLFD